MSVRHDHPEPASGRPKPRPRTLDRLFVGGCTAAYVVLVLAVAVVLTTYGR